MLENLVLKPKNYYPYSTLMTTWVLFIVLHTVSLGFAAISLWRLYHYIRRYRFDESKYTLLFGFLHLRWIAGMYVVLAALWVVTSYMIFTLYA